MNFDIRLPGLLRIGAGVLAEAAATLSAAGSRHPLIVADGVMVQNGTVAQLQSTLAKAGIASEVFADVRPDPTNVEVELGVARYREGGHDALISIGGGSAIDTAKAIGVLVANGGEIRDYKVPAVPALQGPPHIAVPTTAGTGAEVTRFAVISDNLLEEKMLIAGPTLLPTVALVDYELSLSMPARLTADTGIDALTHALEAYMSRRANPFSDALALKAMESIWHALPIAFADPTNGNAREVMMSSATLAGVAFSNASVALVHGMSRPLGVFFHVAHGLSNAMLLPTVTRFSIKSAEERYAQCAYTMGIADRVLPASKAAQLLVDALLQRNAELKVPSPKQYGISEDRYFGLIPKMAEQALASGSPQNNPRVPSQQEIEQLYRDAWC